MKTPSIGNLTPEQGVWFMWVDHMSDFRGFLYRLTFVLGLASLAACSTFGGQPNNYIIFFAEGSSALTAEARAIVDQAATAIRSKNPAMVVVSAGVPTGSNLQLAEPRFEVIHKTLVEDGVPASLIARATLSDPKENVTPLANQRAEILLFVK